MSDTDIHVHVFRPEKRFGDAVIIWRRRWHDGQREMLLFEDGEPVWKEVHDHTAVMPERWTFVLDDEVKLALQKFFTQQDSMDEPPLWRQHIQLQAAARDDAIHVRDRLLTMVETFAEKDAGNTYTTYYPQNYPYRDTEDKDKAEEESDDALS